VFWFLIFLFSLTTLHRKTPWLVWHEKYSTVIKKERIQNKSKSIFTIWKEAFYRDQKEIRINEQKKLNGKQDFCTYRIYLQHHVWNNGRVWKHDHRAWMKDGPINSWNLCKEFLFFCERVFFLIFFLFLSRKPCKKKVSRRSWMGGLVESNDVIVIIIISGGSAWLVGA